MSPAGILIVVHHYVTDEETGLLDAVAKGRERLCVLDVSWDRRGHAVDPRVDSLPVPVIFDRMVRPEWVDYALEQFLVSENEADLRRRLHEYLSSQVQGVYTVQKVARQLQSTVGFTSQIPRQELEQTYRCLCSLAPSERTALRLELLIKATSFVADCMSALPNLRALGVHGVDLGQLYERLVAKYGDRSMVANCAHPP